MSVWGDEDERVRIKASVRISMVMRIRVAQTLSCSWNVKCSVLAADAASQHAPRSVSVTFRLLPVKQ